MRKIMSKIVMASAVLLSFGSFVIKGNVRDVEVKAATTETKRVWFSPDYVGWWTGDSANSQVGIYYFGGSVEGTWAGVGMLHDGANSLWYYDVPSDTTTVIFTRIKVADPSNAWNQTLNVPVGVCNTYKYELWNSTVDGKYEVSGAIEFSPATTDVVSNFAATLDTSAEICNSSAVATALSTYNSLSTFEKNQFDNLDVGGSETGATRLAYLEAMYGVEANSLPVMVNEGGSLELIVTIGIIGLTLLGGFYFLNKKKIKG